MVLCTSPLFPIPELGLQTQEAPGWRCTASAPPTWGRMLVWEVRLDKIIGLQRNVKETFNEPGVSFKRCAEV